jgi:hypothetical protein
MYPITHSGLQGKEEGKARESLFLLRNHDGLYAIPSYYVVLSNFLRGNKEKRLLKIICS